MTSYEYSEMASTELTAPARPVCEHGMTYCNDCLTGAADVLSAMKAEHETALATVRSEHWLAMNALRTEHETWKANLTVDAHEMATENNLCTVFDDFMIEHGLDPRTKEYEVEVSVEMTVRVRVEGRNADDAKEGIDQEMVDDAIREYVDEENAYYRIGYATEVRD